LTLLEFCLGGANPTKTFRGDETLPIWNHNWQFLCHWELWAVFSLRLYGLPCQLVLQSWG